VDEPTVVVGLIGRAHGLRGEVVIHNRSDNPERWRPGAVVFLRDGRPLTVDSVRPRGGDRMIVRFREAPDRAAAERLQGEVSIPESSLPELSDGQWWAHQIEGCEVVTEDGRRLGIVIEVIPNPANDLWLAVDEQGRETLVPALKDVLVDVDTRAKRVLVKDVPGLTVPEVPGA
jgi:16S rRNA processing protein RimM